MQCGKGKACLPLRLSHELGARVAPAGVLGRLDRDLRPAEVAHLDLRLNLGLDERCGDMAFVGDGQCLLLQLGVSGRGGQART